MVLVECLTGRYPFEAGAAGGPMELIIHVSRLQLKGTASLSQAFLVLFGWWCSGQAAARPAVRQKWWHVSHRWVTSLPGSWLLAMQQL